MSPMASVTRASVEASGEPTKAMSLTRRLRKFQSRMATAAVPVLGANSETRPSPRVSAAPPSNGPAMGVPGPTPRISTAGVGLPAGTITETGVTMAKRPAGTLSVPPPAATTASSAAWSAGPSSVTPLPTAPKSARLNVCAAAAGATGAGAAATPGCGATRAGDATREARAPAASTAIRQTTTQASVRRAANLLFNWEVLLSNDLRRETETPAAVAKFVKALVRRNG